MSQQRERIILDVPLALRKMIDGSVPAGQSRAEWIREAIRQRFLREGPTRKSSTA